MKRFLEITVIVILFISQIVNLHSCKKITLPEIITKNVSGVTRISAESGGDVVDNGGAEVISRGVCWGTTQNIDKDNNLNKTSDGKGNGEFTSSLGGLTPNVQYYVRAYATNSEGTGMEKPLHLGQILLRNRRYIHLR